MLLTNSLNPPKRNILMKHSKWGDRHMSLGRFPRPPPWKCGLELGHRLPAFVLFSPATSLEIRGWVPTSQMRRLRHREAKSHNQDMARPELLLLNHAVPQDLFPCLFSVRVFKWEGSPKKPLRLLRLSPGPVAQAC